MGKVDEQRPCLDIPSCAKFEHIVLAEGYNVRIRTCGVSVGAKGSIESHVRDHVPNTFLERRPSRL